MGEIFPTNKYVAVFSTLGTGFYFLEKKRAHQTEHIFGAKGYSDVCTHVPRVWVCDGFAEWIVRTRLNNGLINWNDTG